MGRGIVRLLYLCSDFGIAPNGTKGASIHLRAITRALADAGHEMLLLSPKAEAIPDHPMKPLLADGRSPAESTAKTLKRWLGNRGFSDAVARELRPLLYNTSAPEKALEAMEGRHPDAIIERLSLFGHTGVDLADTLHVPLILEVNAPLTEEAGSFRSLQIGALAAEIEDRVLARADAIVAVSVPLAERLAARGVETTKIHVVPNGVDLRLFADVQPRRSCREGLGLGDEFVVGFAGSLKPWHGVDVLVDAVAELQRSDPSVRLVVVGDGPEQAALRERADRAGMNGSAIFTGAVPHSTVPGLLGAMDVAVAPFKSMEGFYFSPIKLFEYMAAGTCVVASDLGQIRDVVDDGVNGLLCKSDDPGALARVLTQVRESTALRDKLATRALSDVRERYTWSRAAELTLNAVDAAVAGRAKGSPGIGGPVAADRSREVPA